MAVVRNLGDSCLAFGLGGSVDIPNLGILNFANGGTIENTAAGTIEIGLAPSAAGGASGWYISTTRGAIGLTGTDRGLYVVATNGTTTGTGTIRGAEIKARAATGSNVGANLGGLEGISISVDVKNKTVTTIRGIEISLDGGAGGSSTTATGLLISNNSSATQTTSYAIDINSGTASGHKVFTADIRMQKGLLLDNATDSILTIGGGIAASRTLASQTLENIGANLSETSDSTFIAGDNLTYSGGRGSSVAKITGVWTGATGGFHGLYSNVTSSGTIATSGNGVVGIKSVVTNTGAMTDGVIYGGMFIAKHNHATNRMTSPASLIGLESWAYVSNDGPVGTAIGFNAAFHNECTAAYPNGAVMRGIQIVCDNAAGSQKPSESTALCLWNMTGTQDYGIKFVKSGSGFTNDIYFQNTATLTNSAAGAIDIALGTVAGATADNGLAITQTDATTFSSGYANAIYLNLTASGNKTGNFSVSQVNGFGADITIAGTGNYNGGYVYIAKSGSPNLATYCISGWNLDMQELGATDYFSNLHLQKSNTTKGTAVDAFILCSLQLAGVAKSAVHFQGIALPDNFLTIAGSPRDMLTDSAPTHTAHKYLKVSLDGVAYVLDLMSVA